MPWSKTFYAKSHLTAHTEDVCLLRFGTLDSTYSLNSIGFSGLDPPPVGTTEAPLSSVGNFFDWCHRHIHVAATITITFSTTGIPIFTIEVLIFGNLFPFSLLGTAWKEIIPNSSGWVDI
jgi:hypothetical protein